jgi:hypothetical protein
MMQQQMPQQMQQQMPQQMQQQMPQQMPQQMQQQMPQQMEPAAAALAERPVPRAFCDVSGVRLDFGGNWWHRAGHKFDLCADEYEQLAAGDALAVGSLVMYVPAEAVLQSVLLQPLQTVGAGWGDCRSRRMRVLGIDGDAVDVAAAPAAPGSGDAAHQVHDTTPRDL